MRQLPLSELSAMKTQEQAETCHPRVGQGTSHLCRIEHFQLGVRNLRIAAVADVHSPKFLLEFRNSLSKLESPDLILLAGDIVNFGRAAEYRKVLGAIDSELNSSIPIVACFGNEEFAAIRNDILGITKDRVTFLDDESVTFNHGHSRLGIVGTHASFQGYREIDDADSADIRKALKSRARRLSKILKDVARKVDNIILLMHYNPLLENVNESAADSFSWWISQATESIQPDLVIHGHVHNPMKTNARIGRTRVFNVAFPARGEVTQIIL